MSSKNLNAFISKYECQFQNIILIKTSHTTYAASISEQQLSDTIKSLDVYYYVVIRGK